jgi:hypothetical protein
MQSVARIFVRTRSKLTPEQLEAHRLRKREGSLAGRGQFERLLNSALLHGGFNG